MTTEDPYLQDSAESLREQAAGWADACYVKGEPGHCDPHKATWRYEPNYDISKLRNLVEDWPAWFQAECQMAAEDGRENYYDDMLSEPILEAIIVLERDGQGYIWDGWHRTGATFYVGGKALRAIVGTPLD